MKLWSLQFYRSKFELWKSVSRFSISNFYNEFSSWIEHIVVYDGSFITILNIYSCENLYCSTIYYYTSRWNSWMTSGFWRIQPLFWKLIKMLTWGDLKVSGWNTFRWSVQQTLFTSTWMIPYHSCLTLNSRTVCSQPLQPLQSLDSQETFSKSLKCSHWNSR